SDRGTVVLEAAMTSALSSLERASSERSRAEAGFPPCFAAFLDHRCLSVAAVCGQRSSTVPNITQPRSRIVGGSPAAPGSWPWLVNLQLDGAMMCGGVLVDSSWVVTAAHCFRSSRDESSWTAVVGEFDITKTDPDEQVLKVNRIISHPKFNPKTLNNDIALVELTNPVVMSEHVTPVCLPSGSEPPAGSPCLVAGWGSLYEEGPFADAVMEAKVPLLSQSTCKSIFGKELVVNTMFCAGYLSGGIDSCQGDSGGPLLYQDRVSGRFQLYGIISWGNGCGEKGKPGVYTRVSTFSDWIQAEIQKSFGSREPTCPELLKTTEMTEEDQKSEFSSLCRFYTLTCPPTQSSSACRLMAEEKCLTRFKKCQLHSFLQTLLDLLQRAEDYIRDKVDLTFFTQTLPQLVEHIYSTAFAHSRERRDVGLSQRLTQIKGTPHMRIDPEELIASLCPGVKESSQQVSQVRDSYSWILNVPSRNLQMTFQEVLVDLSSKNERGLYQARVRAVVGGRPLTFYSLVGLENESFYRSVPRIIALALEAFKVTPARTLPGLTGFSSGLVEPGHLPGYWNKKMSTDKISKQGIDGVLLSEQTQ
uniref:Serine protease 56 n=1 Tax=Salarias fasciatus TaxID=181472 RepID=A0A672FBZ1_SALFA